MGFVGELGNGLRARKRVVAAVLAIACIGVATFWAGAWFHSTQMLPPRPVAVSAPRPDSPAPPAPNGDDKCCDMKKPDKMMPGAMPMPGGTPMPSGMPMPSSMPMPSEVPMPGRMPMPGRTG
jgi:hypothetical protein